MVSIRRHPTRGTLFLDFRYEGRRCREYTALPDAPANRQRLQRALARIERQIADGTFDYRAAFPSQTEAKTSEAPREEKAPTTQHRQPDAVVVANPATPIFQSFIEQWILNHTVEWRRSHLKTLRSTVDGHLLPAFGNRPVGEITREEMLAFRSARLIRNRFARERNLLQKSLVRRNRAGQDLQDVAETSAS